MILKGKIFYGIKTGLDDQVSKTHGIKISYRKNKDNFQLLYEYPGFLSYFMDQNRLYPKSCFLVLFATIFLTYDTVHRALLNT